MDTVQDILANGGDKVLYWISATLLGLISWLVKNKIKNDSVKTFLGRVFEEVRDTVLAVEQTYVSALRDANADGKLTKEERAEAKRLALATIRSNLGVKGIKKLAKLVGVDVDKWLDTRMEATLADMKSSGTVATSADKTDPP